MNIGLPKECKLLEKRIALTPASVQELSALGHVVLVQSAAGADCGFSDEDYRRAGARICTDLQELYAKATLIVKVKEPQPQELPYLRSDHLLFCYLHLAANLQLTRALMESGCCAIAFETIQQGNTLPLLEPMSIIAGRMSAVVAAHYLSSLGCGNGTLMSAPAGVQKARVVVLGAGTAGLNAARMAAGMGAKVTILDINLQKLQHIEAAYPCLQTLYSQPDTLLEALKQADVLIGAVLVVGAVAPKLLGPTQLECMRPGGVFVDIAIDQGGCSVTSHPTTHADPLYDCCQIQHYCVTNMPSAYARTASMALNNALVSWVKLLANHGLMQALARQPQLMGGINVHKHKLHCQAVAESLMLPYTPWSPGL